MQDHQSNLSLRLGRDLHTYQLGHRQRIDYCWVWGVFSHWGLLRGYLGLSVLVVGVGEGEHFEV